MTIKDPFDRMPPIPADELPVPDEASVGASSSGDDSPVKSSNASRKIFKSLSGTLMILFFGGLLVWLFMTPGNPAIRGVEKPKPGEIDPRKQASDTNALLDTLQADAKAKAGPPKPTADANGKVPNPAASAGSINSVATTNIASANILAEEAKRKADAERRALEILGSPLEAQGGTIKVMSAESVAASNLASGSKARLSALQSGLDSFEKKRADALMANSPDKALEAVRAMTAGQQKTGLKKTDNEEFLSAYADSDGQAKLLRQQNPLARNLISEGTAIRASMRNGINSDLPGKVVAQVTMDVYDSRNFGVVLIPKYSRLIGVYNSQVKVGQARILIAMTRLILPDGTWIPLGGATAGDLIGQSGMEAEVDNHFFKMFASSFVIGAVSLLLPSNDRSITSTTGAGGTTTGGSIAGMALNDSVKNLLDRNKVIAPTLSIAPGAEFVFLTQHDMSLAPYGL